jgi:ribonuclease HI
LNSQLIEIYTDGSCNPKHKIGAWAVIILHNKTKLVLQGTENETTHNRMEILAVINSIEYVIKEFPDLPSIIIYTDSQYVARIPRRKIKLVSKKFTTNSGNLIQNIDLVEKLIQILGSYNIEFIKVKAHQKASELINYNREVDKLCRKLVRQQINKFL